MAKSLRPVPSRVLLSAHRGGCGRKPLVENTNAAFAAAVTMPVVDYVEFDVQRTRDGVYLIHHNDEVLVDGSPTPVPALLAAEVDLVLGRRTRYSEVLALLAQSGRKAHLDFKFTSPDEAYADPATTYEVEATRLAVAALGAENVVVTTDDDRSVLTVRNWADGAGLPLLVGLSIGRHRLRGMSWTQRLRWRVGELFPDGRIHRSRANLVVAQRHLARARLISMAARRGLPVLVWTVDSQKEMARLLADPRVWMVTSNFPERATPLRGLPAAA